MLARAGLGTGSPHQLRAATRVTNVMGHRSQPRAAQPTIELATSQSFAAAAASSPARLGIRIVG